MKATYMIYVEQAEKKTEEAYNSIVKDNPWLNEVLLNALKIANENSSVQSKYQKFKLLVDVLNDAISKHAQCKRGCSECCKIAVSVSGIEAKEIARVTGRKLKGPIKSYFEMSDQELEQEMHKYFGVPCPFLKDNECSIYEFRPMACRLHHNLGDALFCSTSILPEDSYVSNINFVELFKIMAVVFAKYEMADIREFFD